MMNTEPVEDNELSNNSSLASPTATTPVGPTLSSSLPLPVSASSGTGQGHPTPGYAKRVKGVALHRSIVYGNSATAIKKSENENTHHWTLYVRGFNHEDISYYVSKVEYKLHESFAEPIRTIDRWPFEITEAGWGEFEIQIKIYFVDPNEKVLSLSHFLRLYPLEDPFMIRHPPNKHGTVITEQYDEIVFYDPTLIMHSVLTDATLAATSTAQFAPNSAHDVAEREEIARLDEAKKRILTEIERLKSRLGTKDLKKPSSSSSSASSSSAISASSSSFGSQFVL